MIRKAVVILAAVAAPWALIALVLQLGGSGSEAPLSSPVAVADEPAAPVAAAAAAAAPAVVPAPGPAAVVPPRSASAADDLTHASRLAKRLSGSLVRVSTHLKYHDGEAPRSLTLNPRTVQRVMAAQRPLIETGLVIDRDLVVTEDLGIPDRFVARYEVESPLGRAAARPERWLVREAALTLRLEGTPSWTVPLALDPAGGAPSRSLTIELRGEDAFTIVRPAFEEVLVGDDGRASAGTWRGGLLLDVEDRPVGITWSGWVNAHSGWRTPLGDRLALGRESLDGALKRLQELSDRTLLRVDVRLSSPKSLGGDAPDWREERRREKLPTSLSAPGFLVRRDLLVVPGQLDADSVERLESVEVRDPSGKTLVGQYAGGLRDLHAFLVRMPTPVGEPLRLPHASLPDDQDARGLVVDLEVRFHGAARSVFASPTRITDFEAGWRGHARPNLAGEPDHHVLFALDGTLLALPIAARGESAEPDYDDEPDVDLVPAHALGEMLAHLDRALDPALAPPTPGVGGRLAWLGVEVQAMDAALAKAHGVGALTDGGRFGMLVAHVYPSSPAARLGLAPGDLLLRLTADGGARPTELVASGPDEASFEERHPEMYDEDDVLEANLERSAWTPWPNAESRLNKALSEFGVGSRVRLDYARKGAPMSTVLDAQASPQHYGSVPRHVAASSGVTFVDLTYEVRRHFRLAADASGCLVARIDPGSPAHVGGLRRFDVVLAAEGRPVQSAQQLARTLEGKGEIELRVLDVARERSVTLRARPSASRGAK